MGLGLVLLIVGNSIRPLTAEVMGGNRCREIENRLDRIIPCPPNTMGSQQFLLDNGC